MKQLHATKEGIGSYLYTPGITVVTDYLRNHPLSLFKHFCNYAKLIRSHQISVKYDVIM